MSSSRTPPPNHSLVYHLRCRISNDFMSCTHSRKKWVSCGDNRRRNRRHIWLQRQDKETSSSHIFSDYSAITICKTTTLNISQKISSSLFVHNVPFIGWPPSNYQFKARYRWLLEVVSMLMWLVSCLRLSESCVRQTAADSRVICIHLRCRREVWCDDVIDIKVSI